jgi:DNA-binding response OmpR family regulator
MASTSRPDVVLLDIDLPGMDGFVKPLDLKVLLEMFMTVTARPSS